MNCSYCNSKKAVTKDKEAAACKDHMGMIVARKQEAANERDLEALEKMFNNKDLPQ